jgi:hypothetical protein
MSGSSNRPGARPAAADADPPTGLAQSTAALEAYGVDPARVFDDWLLSCGKRRLGVCRAV